MIIKDERAIPDGKDLPDSEQRERPGLHRQHMPLSKRLYSHKKDCENGRDMSLSTVRCTGGKCEYRGVQARRFPSRDDESDNGKEHKVEDSAGAGRYTNPIASDDRD